MSSSNHKNKSPLPSETNNFPPATFFKLLGSTLYDFMLLCAVWLVAGFVYIIPAQMLTDIDATEKNNLTTTEFSGPVFYIYLFIVTWFFFAWFWTHGGQTLGLSSWSLKLQTNEGKNLRWAQTFLRFLIAGTPWLLALFAYDQVLSHQLLASPYHYSVFLIGFISLIWTLIDKQKRSIQDILTKSQIVIVPKKSTGQKLYR